MITLECLQEQARAYLAHAPENRVPPEKALEPGLAGLRMFETAIFGAASAEDPLMLELCQPSTAGLVMDAPTAWLSTARTVISFFLPFTEAVRASNRVWDDRPSAAWKHARIEGQACLIALCGHLEAFLTEKGYTALTPAKDPRVWSDSWNDAEHGGMKRYRSNWSERHVAYVCGLGTFSRSKGLITALGVAGRFGSLITDLAVPETPRPYARREEYCTRCGACARHCPVHAITMEAGKDDALCSALLAQIRRENEPYYGCGKCQVGVPCEKRIPG